MSQLSSPSPPATTRSTPQLPPSPSSIRGTTTTLTNNTATTSSANATTTATPAVASPTTSQAAMTVNIDAILKTERRNIERPVDVKIRKLMPRLTNSSGAVAAFQPTRTRSFSSASPVSTSKIQTRHVCVALCLGRMSWEADNDTVADDTKAPALTKVFAWRAARMLGGTPKDAGNRVDQLFVSQLEKVRKGMKVMSRVNPSPDDCKEALRTLKREAAGDRVLFYYFGNCGLNGLRRPEKNTIYLYNIREQPQPLLLDDLLGFDASPQVLIFDCPSAGHVLKRIHAEQTQRARYHRAHHHVSSSSPQSPTTAGGAHGSNVVVSSSPNTTSWDHRIFFGACAEGEVQPSHSLLPNDVFSSCMLTPIKMGLLWFVIQHRAHYDVPLGIIHTLGATEDIKGTPMNELKRVFNAITDTIAWQLLPVELYHKLFRQDTTLVYLFRSFLLAERIIRELGCTPCSAPVLPSACRHPLWRSWDVALHTTVTAVMRCIRLGPPRSLGINELRMQLDELLAPCKLGIPQKETAVVVTSPVSTGNGGTLTATIAPAAGDGSANSLSSIVPQITTLGDKFNVGTTFIEDELRSMLSFYEGTNAHALTVPERLTQPVFLKPHYTSGIVPQDHSTVSHTAAECSAKLPIVVAGLAALATRVPALRVLCHFLDRGPWAVEVCEHLKLNQEILKIIWTRPQLENRPYMVFLGAKNVFQDPNIIDRDTQGNVIQYCISQFEKPSTCDDIGLCGSELGQKLLCLSTITLLVLENPATLLPVCLAHNLIELLGTTLVEVIEQDPTLALGVAPNTPQGAYWKNASNSNNNNSTLRANSNLVGDGGEPAAAAPSQQMSSTPLQKASGMGTPPIHPMPSFASPPQSFGIMSPLGGNNGRGNGSSFNNTLYSSGLGESPGSPGSPAGASSTPPHHVALYTFFYRVCCALSALLLYEFSSGSAEKVLCLLSDSILKLLWGSPGQLVRKTAAHCLHAMLVCATTPAANDQRSRLVATVIEHLPREGSAAVRAELLATLYAFCRTQATALAASAPKELMKALQPLSNVIYPQKQSGAPTAAQSSASTNSSGTKGEVGKELSAAALLPALTGLAAPSPTLAPQTVTTLRKSPQPAGGATRQSPSGPSATTSNDHNVSFLPPLDLAASTPPGEDAATTSPTLLSGATRAQPPSRSGGPPPSSTSTSNAASPAAPVVQNEEDNGDDTNNQNSDGGADGSLMKAPALPLALRVVQAMAILAVDTEPSVRASATRVLVKLAEFGCFPQPMPVAGTMSNIHHGPGLLRPASLGVAKPPPTSGVGGRGTESFIMDEQSLSAMGDVSFTGMLRRAAAAAVIASRATDRGESALHQPGGSGPSSGNNNQTNNNNSPFWNRVDSATMDDLSDGGGAMLGMMGETDSESRGGSSTGGGLGLSAGGMAAATGPSLVSVRPDDLSTITEFVLETLQFLAFPLIETAATLGVLSSTSIVVNDPSNTPTSLTWIPPAVQIHHLANIFKNPNSPLTMQAGASFNNNGSIASPKMNPPSGISFLGGGGASAPPTAAPVLGLPPQHQLLKCMPSDAAALTNTGGSQAFPAVHQYATSRADSLETYLMTTANNLARTLMFVPENRPMQHRLTYELESRVLRFHPTEPYCVSIGQSGPEGQQYVHILSTTELNILESYQVASGGVLRGSGGEQDSSPNTPRVFTPSAKQASSTGWAAFGGLFGRGTGGDSPAAAAPPAAPLEQVSMDTITDFCIVDPSHHPVLLTSTASGGVGLHANLMPGESANPNRIPTLLATFNTLPHEYRSHSHRSLLCYHASTQLLTVSGWRTAVSTWDLQKMIVVDERCEVLPPAATGISVLTPHRSCPTAFFTGYSDTGLMTLIDLRARRPAAILDSLHRSTCLSITSLRPNPHCFTGVGTSGVVAVFDDRRLTRYGQCYIDKFQLPVNSGTEKASASSTTQSSTRGGGKAASPLFSDGTAVTAAEVHSCVYPRVLTAFGTTTTGTVRIFSKNSKNVYTRLRAAGTVGGCAWHPSKVMCAVATKAPKAKLSIHSVPEESLDVFDL